MSEQASQIQRDLQLHYSTEVSQQRLVLQLQSQMRVKQRGYQCRLHACAQQAHQPNLQQRSGKQTGQGRKTFLNSM